MDPTKLTQGDGPHLSLDDLIKINTMQKLIAEGALKCLEQAKADQERLKLQEQELERLKRLQVAWEIEQLTKGTIDEN